jgi:uncharacterized protein (TIGR03086 family)
MPTINPRPTLPDAAVLAAFDAVAVAASVRAVADATDADLDRPTPCAAWSLRDLLAHMTTQHRGFAAASRGETDADVWRTRPSGADPVGDYRAAAEAVQEAFAAPDIADRAFALPEIHPEWRFPAAQAISFHFVDYVVHSWDVARALGRDVRFPAGLLDAALVVARAVPGGDARLSPTAAFGPELPRPAEATVLDDILATLGRDPRWRP